MKKLENKTVFITGGLSGIGKACAFAAAKEGANVVIADLKSDTAGSTVRELKLINSKAVFVECDVSVYKQVESAIQHTTGIFKSVDVALNNAGIEPKYIVGDLDSISAELKLKFADRLFHFHGRFNGIEQYLRVQADKQTHSSQQHHARHFRPGDGGEVMLVFLLQHVRTG